MVRVRLRAHERTVEPHTDLFEQYVSEIVGQLDTRGFHYIGSTRCLQLQFHFHVTLI